MIRLRAPTDAELERRVRTADPMPYSFRAGVRGATAGAGIPADYGAGEWEIALGRGAPRFEAACAAIARFEHFPRELVRVHPADVPPRAGAVVALHARAGPFHADLACRIVATVDDSTGEGAERVRRRGFAYGTTEGHVERGEERFIIEHRTADDAVTYRIRAVSRPAHPIAWLAQPWVRSLQRRFGRLSAAALRRAVGAEGDLPLPRELARRPPAGLPWLGAAAFAIVALAISPPLADALVALAALVLLPAARALLPERWGWIRGATPTSLWFVAALLLAIAPALPSGWPAAAAAAPWFVATATAALLASRDLLTRGGRAPEDAGAIAGLLLLPVGSLWSLFAHLGRWPGDFPPPIPALTAAHFHYAGAIAPLVLGRAAAALSPRLAAPFSALWVAGMTAVAIGITLSPALEAAAALALVALAAAGGALQLRASIRSRSRLGALLLALGGASLLVGLGLAATYALLEHRGALRGEEAYTGGGILTWQRMLLWHGTTMALGFALPSVLGWDATRECSEPEPVSAPRAGRG